MFFTRCVDYFQHRFDQERDSRERWLWFHPRIISSGILAWVYVFVSLRVLSVIRTNRIIGPLLISLAKMTRDVLQFLGIFFVVLFSFALGMTELFWYYGTPKGKSVHCHSKNNVTDNCLKVFTGLGSSMGDLFWSLFGYLELSEIPSNDQLTFSYYDGFVLLGTYHVFAVIILINMLIAMMALSFEVTSENRDAEWKFHRTVVWISYVQREFTRPPPMNLLPNLYAVFFKLRKFFRWIFFSLCRCNATWFRRRQRSRSETEQLQRQFKDMERESFYIKKNLRKLRSQEVEAALVERYKFGKLLTGTIHHHKHWQARKFRNW